VPLAAQTYKVQFTAGRSFRDKVCQAQDLMRHRVPDGNLETIFEAALDLLIDQVQKERFALGRKPRGEGGGRGDDRDGGGGDFGEREQDGAAVTTNEAKPRSVPAETATASISASEAGGTPASVAGMLTGGSGAKEGTAPRTKSPDNEKRGGVSRHVPDGIRRAVYKRDGGRCTFVNEKGKRCPETGGLELDHVDGFAETRKHDIQKLRLLCRAHNQREAEKKYGRAFMMSARKSRSAPSTRSGTSPVPATSG
jgi:hypothetical protein